MYAKKAAYLTSIDSMVGALLSLPCGKCDGNRELWWYSRLLISTPRVINRTDVEVPYLGG